MRYESSPKESFPIGLALGLFDDGFPPVRGGARFLIIFPSHVGPFLRLPQEKIDKNPGLLKSPQDITFLFISPEGEGWPWKLGTPS